MSLYDRVLIWVGITLIALTIAGLIARGRARSCQTFVLYLAGVAIASALIVLWPQQFFRQWFWIFKESILNALKLGIGLELMVRIFRPFPSAYAAARLLVFLVLLGLGLLVWFARAHGTDYVDVVGRLHPYVNDGTVWLFVALGASALWYHLPLDSIHKAILIGLVPFLLVYSVILRVLVSVGWERGDIFNSTIPYAYSSVLAYWAWVAWRRAPEDDSGTRVARMVSRRAAPMYDLPLQ